MSTSSPTRSTSSASARMASLIRSTPEPSSGSRAFEPPSTTGANEPARVRSALDQLGAAGVTSILLEGGPRLAGSFMDGGEIDEVRLFVAPLVLGGRTARDPLEGQGVDRVADALRAITLDCKPLAGDVLITARLREW